VVVVLIWLVYGGPLLLTIGTALGTMYWLGHRGEFLNGSRVPVGLLIADLAIFALGLAVVATAPDSQETSNGQVCKDARDFDEVLYPLVFGSAIVGGLHGEPPASKRTRAMESCSPMPVSLSSSRTRLSSGRSSPPRAAGTNQRTAESVTGSPDDVFRQTEAIDRRLTQSGRRCRSHRICLPCR